MQAPAGVFKRNGQPIEGFTPVQVAAYLKGNAVGNLVQNALSGSGTPNLLLQTDLAQQATVTIVPDTLPPVVLYEGSFGTSSVQTLTLTNTDINTSSSVDFAVSPPGFPFEA